MGKYTDQASSYKNGMDMLRAGLEKALAEMEKIKTLVATGDSRDALNYYVSEFNTEITVSLNEIMGKSISLPASVMAEAQAIDYRIEKELEEARRRQEELEKAKKNNKESTSDVSTIQQNDAIMRNDLSDKMGW